MTPVMYIRYSVESAPGRARETYPAERSCPGMPHGHTLDALITKCAPFPNGREADPTLRGEVI